MKAISKLLLVGAVAVAAIAISAAPSEAAKKAKRHHHMAAAHSMTCAQGNLCSTGCQGGNCSMNVCGADHKWYPAILTPICFAGHCPAKC